MKMSLALVGAFLVTAAAPQNGNDSMRTLLTVKEAPFLQVLVPQDKQAWCGPVAKITLRAETAAQLMENQALIERLVGGIRAALSFECPQATSMRFAGVISGQPLYSATASQTGDWKLANILLQTPEQLRKAVAAQAIERCDRLASDPADPEAVMPGINEDALNAADAVGACREAVAADPAMPRLRFQLARGLLKSGETEQAAEQLVTAGEAGHGGALALLADFNLHGAAGIEVDPETARSLYQRAADAGYAPAKQVLASFEEQTRQIAQAEAAEKAALAAQRREEQAFAAQAARETAAGGALNANGYEAPHIVQGIYSGKFDTIDAPEMGVKIYLINMAESFRQICRGSFTINEMNELRMTGIDKSQFTPEAGGAALMDLLGTVANLAQNPGSMVDMARNSQAAASVPQQASEDAMLFVERNNCATKAFTRFTTNLRAYLNDTGLAMNFSAPEYVAACRAATNSRHYEQSDYCMCFLSRANSAGISRPDKLALLRNFGPTADQIAERNGRHFAMCYGSMAR